ncbi:MAG: 1-deoxy-D-xylulose-5-phosphate reductoisomerase [Rhodospirillales bacterium]|nr:1-deoxy-D-xylulose-5-phosphate reductoisomerase [Alphaproteobacteria bacterium]MCB9987378.1 1-deoxy-D-xylulose-5-phosphate reductoisomerase [Rhodospirillales bacterium]USO07775.1 MAG: 1-deoxy-D-xylulose-5-phosphate reductoisomerase [Rhodospirillales bacterium]
MTRSVTVLGSTGSVGRQTLDVVAHHGAERFRVAALAAGSDVDTLAAQARHFRPRFVAVADESRLDALRASLSDLPDIEVAGGREAVMDVARMDADTTMCAIVGTAGLLPTMAAIKRGGCVAFASKECLVAAGPLMMEAVARHGARFLPVDSEHNAIFQVLQKGPGVRRIVLTASGGPFRTWGAAQIAAATPAQAVNHPTWSMGKKISVDSATLMNKALEVIEAHHLFALPSAQIDVVLHPQSTVHGMVEYADGSFLAQLGPADMRTPIAVCLGWPERIESAGARMDLATLAKLEFEAVDTARFPAMRLVREVLAGSPADSIVFNAANEVAVAAFLAGRISFPAIVSCVARMLESCDKPAIKTLDDVAAYDDNVRRATHDALKKAA